MFFCHKENGLGLALTNIADCSNAAFPFQMAWGSVC